MKLICNYYIRNYGSVLQSYAAFRVLNELGHETRVICYRDRPCRKAKAEIALRIRLKYLANRAMVKPLTRLTGKRSGLRSPAIPPVTRRPAWSRGRRW